MMHKNISFISGFVSRLMTQFQQLHSLPCTHYMIVQDLVQEHKQEEIPLYRVILVSNEKAKQLRSTSTILKEHIHTLFPSGGSKQQNTPVCIVSHNSFIKPCECVDQSIETVYMQDENENMRKRKDFPSSPSSSSSSSLDYKKQKTHQQQTLLGFFSRK